MLCKVNNRLFETIKVFGALEYFKAVQFNNKTYTKIHGVKAVKCEQTLKKNNHNLTFDNNYAIKTT